MKLQSLIEAKILVVEDNKFTLQDNVQYINEIEESSRARVGIAGFVTDTAGSTAATINRLAQSVQSPYHIVLLDLNLPGASLSETDIHAPQATFAAVDRGYEILDYIEQSCSAEAVIIVSAFPESAL